MTPTAETSLPSPSLTGRPEGTDAAVVHGSNASDVFPSETASCVIMTGSSAPVTIVTAGSWPHQQPSQHRHYLCSALALGASVRHPGV